MAEGLKLFGLDEKINIAGRITTIREQQKQGNVTTIQRGINGRIIGKNSWGHWVVVQKDANSTEQFPISEDDFKSLRGI